MADLKLITAHYIHKHKIPYTPETLTQDCIDLVEYFDCIDVIPKACIEGLSLDNIKYLIKVYKFDNWDFSMIFAAEGGHRELVDFFITKGADSWNWVMEGAARGGHLELVKFFISKGAYHLDRGICQAIKYGYRDLVFFFISKGANWWNLYIIEAITFNHKDLVLFFIDKCNQRNIDWNNCMCAAITCGNKELVDLFISKGAYDWDTALDEAQASNNVELIKFFKQKLNNF